METKDFFISTMQISDLDDRYICHGNESSADVEMIEDYIEEA